MNEREIFDAALAIADPDERSRYLDRACADDSGLRQHLRGLLEAHEKLGGFLQLPLAAGEGTIAQAYPLAVGALIVGRYKLLEQIGEGGMGAVWVAEQTKPVKRRVALKLIKPGMDSRQVLSRFEAERQALALMDHPHIARVFDGGLTEDGRPYFVMEYVKGAPITQYCDQARLPIDQRLKLFVQVCQAVQHAHQKGIIHRDLKPSNILVCLYDGQPVPKVIDFGLAKAMHQSLTERTVYTAHGLMVGTPLYMSPEQAEFNNLDVDTRSDVYSLGVLLYELLTGGTPLEQRQFKDAALAEILRLIKEEEPTKPSLKLSGSASLPSIAAQRGIEPTQLSRKVKGDLDWIVMKSLEKERSRRYETANGLARDIERYLADEPVEACPPSLRYRLGKTLRRNRGPAIAAALVFLALGAGVVGTTLGLLRANAERRRANEEAAAAKAVRDFLQEDLLRQASVLHQVETADPATAEGQQFLRNPTIHELLDRAAAELEGEKVEAKFPGLPFVQAEVLKAVGDAYAGVAPEKAIDHLHRAIERYRSSRGPDDPATIAARHSLGVALFTGRKDQEARKTLEAVRDDRARVLGPYHLDTFATRDFLGRTMLETKDPAAIAYFQQLHDDARAHLGEQHVQALKAQFHLGMALMHAGRLDDALQQMEAVKTACQRLNLPSDHPYALAAGMTLGQAYKAAGRNREAVAEFEKCLELVQRLKLGPGNEWVARHELGWVYLGLDRDRDAVKAFEENLAIAGPAGARDIVTREALGWALRKIDVHRAIDMYEEARKLRTERSGADDPEALRVGRMEAMAMRQAKRAHEALALLEDIIPRMEKAHGPDHLELLKALLERAHGLSETKSFEEADAAFQDVIPRLERLRGAGDRETLSARHSWVLAAERAKQNQRAAELAGELIARRRSVDGPNSKLLAGALFAQGRNLVIAGRPVEAEPVLAEALAIYLKVCPELWIASNCKQWLGMALQDQEKLAAAEPQLVAAFSEFTARREQMPPWGFDSCRDVARRLVALYTSQGKSSEADKWQEEVDALSAQAAAREK